MQTIESRKLLTRFFLQSLENNNLDIYYNID